MSEIYFIPEIFYYCDRWCQNCPFTEKCVYFQTFRSKQVEASPYPLPPAEFWKYIQDAIKPVQQFLYEWTHEHNFPLKEEIQSLSDEMDKTVKDVSAHPLSKLAILYGTQVELTLTRYKELIQQTLTNPHPDAPDFYLPPKAILDVIKRYQHQIYTQLAQSLEKLGFADQPISPIDQQDKAKGMIKTTLIMMDCSMAAWGLLSDEIQDAQDALFQLLILLEKMRYCCLALFPDAYDFVRPGFDQRIV